jgi:hypothetical protein
MLQFCLTKHHHHQVVPPYIDVLGRGPNFRATDQLHLRFQSEAKCYFNPYRFGTGIYQRLADFLGPQYDIQFGRDNQGFAPLDENRFSSLGCSVIFVAFYYLCGHFSLLMPYWL